MKVIEHLKYPTRDIRRKEIKNGKIEHRYTINDVIKMYNTKIFMVNKNNDYYQFLYDNGYEEVKCDCGEVYVCIVNEPIFCKNCKKTLI